MSILIKGMEMPTDKEIILRIDEKGEVYIYGSYPTELYSAVDDADALNDAHNEGYDVGYWAGRRDYECKHGKWTLFENDIEQNAYECSVCKDVFVLLEGTPQDNLYNFCPNCGAKMESEGEDGN